jgi:hypothetical protein
MGHKRVKTEAKNVDRTGLSERGKDTLAMLTALEDEDKLNDWEIGFVSSVSDWFLVEQRELTPNQFDRLKIIYDKFN